MSRVIVYLRVSTDEQDAANQRHGVEAFCRHRGLTVSKWVEDTVSGSKAVDKRKLGTIVKQLSEGDIIVAAELSRLSRNLLDLMSLLQTCMKKGIKVLTVKDGYELGDNLTSKVLAFAFGLAAEIEREMISARTKEALARRKAAGKKLGPQFGSRKLNTKVSVQHDRLIQLAESGLNQKKIAQKLKVSRQTVGLYCKEHGIQLPGSRFTKNLKPGRITL